MEIWHKRPLHGSNDVQLTISLALLPVVPHE
jgi:hypothetical protein